MKAAAIQINSTTDGDRNLETAGGLVRGAAEAGAELIVLPEKWPWLAAGAGVLAGAQSVDGSAIEAAREWADGLSIHLVAGSFTESRENGSLSNTSLLIGPEGDLLSEYRKIHMFDVDVDGIEYRESSWECPGSELGLGAVGEATVGIAVCYDLRFPELFRAMADRGATVFAVPAAFTPRTGEDHWEVLLRARAIENQAFVVAAGQVGEAEPGFGFWGHSMIIDPWGRILASLDGGEGFILADLDLAELERIRTDLPALEHRRSDLFPGAVA